MNYFLIKFASVTKEKCYNEKTEYDYCSLCFVRN